MLNSFTTQQPGLILLQGLVVRPLQAHLNVTARKERQHFDLLLPDFVLKNSLILVFFKIFLNINSETKTHKPQKSFTRGRK